MALSSVLDVSWAIAVGNEPLFQAKPSWFIGLCEQHCEQTPCQRDAKKERLIREIFTLYAENLADLATTSRSTEAVR